MSARAGSRRFASALNALARSEGASAGSSQQPLGALRGFASSSAAAEAPLPTSVRIVDVGPRDGLQNEPELVPTDVKVRLIEKLAEAGVPAVEATSFVSPKWVPQLADGADVMARLRRRPGTRYPVLTPNLRGLEGALAAGASEVAVFPAASEAFSRRNLNCSVDEGLRRFGDVARAALGEGLAVRGYVSVAAGCPYQGAVPPEQAAAVAREVLDMGCYEVSMGDTIGAATPAAVRALFGACLGAGIPADRLAGHFHDTYGMAIANTLAALQMGVATFDASCGGLGGCPFAPGASGNLATEDLVFLLVRAPRACRGPAAPPPPPPQPWHPPAPVPPGPPRPRTPAAPPRRTGSASPTASTWRSSSRRATSRGRPWGGGPSPPAPAQPCGSCASAGATGSGSSCSGGQRDAAGRGRGRPCGARPPSDHA